MSDSAIEQRLLPDNATVGDGSQLVAGVRLTDIARDFGTPTFVYDEDHLRRRCQEAVAAFPDGVAYASKAFLCKDMVRIAIDAGMSIDVATGGEMHVALVAGADPSRLVLHGNNKSHDEIAEAINVGVGTIVIDSFDEIDRIAHCAPTKPVHCLVRVTPGVEAHTHEFVRTGADDSKFGFNLANGDAQKAVDIVCSHPSFDFGGIHTHIGSQIFDEASFAQSVEVIAPFVKANGARQLCVGGGLGVAYVAGEAAPSITEWGAAVKDALRQAGIDDVAVTAEPGRSITAAAALTLYTVGTIKDIPGVRTYISVDGGMSDNPRPVLYGSGYEAFLPRSPQVERPKTATISGKHCESGDFLVNDAQVPDDIAVGDVLCTPVTGAYGYSMASHYNRMARPAVVFVSNGQARCVLRRETTEDLLRFDC
jgi:diaminopimelate decarboxylase